MVPGLSWKVLVSALCIVGCGGAQLREPVASLAPPAEAVEELVTESTDAVDAADTPVAEGRVAPTGRSNDGTAASPTVAAPTDAERERRELLAAEAFERAEAARAAFEGFRIEMEPYGGLSGRVDGLVLAIREAFARASRINADYDVSMGGADPDREIDALARSGQVWEILSRALELPPPLETSLSRSAPEYRPVDGAPRPWSSAGGDAESWTPPGASTPRPEELLAVYEAIARVYDPWREAIQCVAVARYVSAARLARARTTRTSAIELAWARLASYSPVRIEECIEVTRRGDPDHGIAADPTFGPYVPGETYRAAPGMTASAPASSSVPLDRRE